MENSAVAIFALSIVSLALTWLMVILRLIVRTKIRPSFGVDDCLLIVGWLLATAQFIVPLYEPKCKTRKDPDLFTLDDLESNYLCRFSGELLWVSATGLVKISFCFTLLRFLQARWQCWCAWSLAAMIALITVFYFFWIVFDCEPVRYFWERVKAPKSGSCRPVAMLADATYAHASVLIFGDAVLAILPVFVVRQLHANWRIKISVMAILTIGSISCVATIVRITLVHEMLATGDFLKVTTRMVIWGIVEVATAIVAVSATALRPLGETVLRAISRYSSGSGSWGTSGQWPYESSERGMTQLHNLPASRTTSTDKILRSHHRSLDLEETRLEVPKRTVCRGCG